MKRFKKLFTLLLAAPLFLSGCVMNNGICYEHVDNNKDGICDVCGHKVKTSGGGASKTSDIEGNPCTTHVDHDLDGKCDKCGADLSVAPHDHVDGDQNGACDICGASMIICNNHVDSNGDGKCDHCGAQMPVVHGDVTVYLVLSSIGLYKGAKGTTYSEVNVEYAVKYIQPVGTALPGAQDVTHINGNADFTGWVAYEGLGAPTVYTTVPNKNNKILYAQFKDNGGVPTPPQPDEPDTPETTRAITLQTTFGDQNWSKDNAKIYAYCWGGSKGYPIYLGTANTGRTEFTFNIGTSWTSILFARVNPNGDFKPSNWDNVWTQTEDLSIDTTKSTAKILSWDGGQDGCSGVSWIS